MNFSTRSLASAGVAGGTGRRITRVVLIAGLLIGGLTGAQAADAASSVQLTHRTLTITDSAASDKLAPRLRAGDPRILQVDVGDDGSADFQVRRHRFAPIIVNAGDGDDLVRIDESNGAFTTATPTQINGQGGDDTLLGGNGAETLNGGDGNDVVDGNGGADHVTLGAGDDRFAWDPGDGSDVVEGQDGHDAMTFNAANIGEQFDVSANGSRVRFTRDVGGIVMDLAGIEEVDLSALGGADRLNVNDLSGTGLTEIQTDLAGTPRRPRRWSCGSGHRERDGEERRDHCEWSGRQGQRNRPRDHR